MMLCVLFAYAIVMVCWPTIVAFNRWSRSRYAIAFCAVALPFVMVWEVFVMALSESNPDLGWTVYMPSVAGIVYIASSIMLVVWAYRSQSSTRLRGFPIEPIVRDDQEDGNHE